MGWVDVSQYGLARIRHIEGSKISNQDISLVAIENVMSATFVHSAHDSYPPAVGNDCGPSNLKRIQTVDYFGPKKTNVLSVIALNQVPRSSSSMQQSFYLPKYDSSRAPVIDAIEIGMSNKDGGVSALADTPPSSGRMNSPQVRSAKLRPPLSPSPA